MSFNRMVVVALLVVAGIGGALACGPDFPWQLLNNRDQTVSDRVELNFAFEATGRPKPVEQAIRMLGHAGTATMVENKATLTVSVNPTWDSSSAP